VTAGRAVGSSQSIFTEGRKGNEAPGVGSHQISKQGLLLPLMMKFQRRFAIFCSKQGMFIFVFSTRR
jgi:hypothetical protein